METEDTFPSNETFPHNFLDIISDRIPTKLDISRFVIQHLIFGKNPIVKDICDFLIQDGKLAKISEKFAPLCEALESSREQILGLAEKFGILPSRKKPRFHKPLRISNPLADFDEQFISEYNKTSEKPHVQQLDVILCGVSRYREGENDDPRKVSSFEYGIIPKGANQYIEANTPDTIDGIPVKIAEYDDLIKGGIPIKEILEHARDNPSHVTIVCLTSIQTNQYPRAKDVALKLQASALAEGLNLKVIIGGPHIRAHKPSQEELSELGIITTNGEIEERRFPHILADLLYNKQKTTYNFSKKVDISDTPLPYPQKRSNYIVLGYQTFQSSRGCPHNCNFCAVTGIDGKEVRSKTTQEVEIWLREAIKNGNQTVFLTDDNFNRQKYQEDILRMIARVRKEMNSDILVMYQSDLIVIKNGEIDTEFMDLCKEAGVYMIFFGQESYDPKILRDEMRKNQNIAIPKSWRNGKKLNEITEEDLINYAKRFTEEWKKRGISTNSTVMFGFKQHTKGIGKKTAEIARHIGIDIVTPFILTHLPGSKDYSTYCEGENAEQNRKQVGMKIIDPDFNNTDALHGTIGWEEGLSPEEIEQEFWEFFDTFYKFKNIDKDKLSNPAMLSFYLWHCFAATLRRHPMFMGLWQLENVDEELTEEQRTKLKNNIKFLLKYRIDASSLQDSLTVNESSRIDTQISEEPPAEENFVEHRVRI